MWKGLSLRWGLKRKWGLSPLHLLTLTNGVVVYDVEMMKMRRLQRKECAWRCMDICEQSDSCIAIIATMS